MKNFVSPHVHIKSLDSVGNVEDFARKEIDLDTGYLVVTDHGTLEACRSVYDICNSPDSKYKGKLRPICGIEAYMRDDDCSILQANGVAKTLNNPKRKDGEEEVWGYKNTIKYIHITLHALDETAFFELTKTLSKADYKAEKHGSERKPLFDWNDLAHLGQFNITATSGCLIGAVGRHLMKNNDMASAVGYYQKIRSLFKPGNFFVEIMPHSCDKNWVKNVTFEFEGHPALTVQAWKKCQTNAGDFEAEELAKSFKSNPEAFWKTHKTLVAVMDNRKWTPKNLGLKTVILFEGALHNECTDWAPDGAYQIGLNKALIELANKNGDPILISDDSHFPSPDLKLAQDVKLGQGGSWKFTENHHRYSSKEAFSFFEAKMGMTLRKFEEYVENGYTWASRFNEFKFSPRQTLPVDFYPKDTLKYIVDIIRAKRRMKWDNPVYIERLTKEIKMLHENGKIDLLPYFATSEEGVREANLHGVYTGVGRGSSAGLLLAYCLGITHLDPIEEELSEDRFLTTDRILSGKMPDIDQDFENTDVITGENGWLQRRFGDCAAQIATDVTAHLSSAIKDVWRAKYGEVPDEIEEFAKKLPKPPQGVNDIDFVFGYDSPEGEVPGVLDLSDELQRFTKKYPQEWGIVTQLLATTRQRSRHPCARAIANEPIGNFIPMTTIGDVRVTAFTASGVEAMGVLKMDYLTINTLGFIHGAVKLVQDRYARHIDWSPSRKYQKELPFVTNNDGKAIEMLYALPFQGNLYSIWDLPRDAKAIANVVEGNVQGVFQLDTTGAQKWLRVFNFDKPDGTGKGLSTVQDLCAFVALDRPGPLDAYVQASDGTKHNMLVEYARRAKGMAYCGDIPELSKLIPETLGIPIYQEQVTKIYKYFTGCTGAEAEEFRSFAAKKKVKKMQEAYTVFMEKAVTRVSSEIAQQIWDRLVTFSNYGFCIDGDQKILTSSGYIPMKDIDETMDVASWDGSNIFYEKPANVWNSGEKEVFEVELEDGTIIRATGDHKFLYEGEWVSLNDIIYVGAMEALTYEEQTKNKM